MRDGSESRDQNGLLAEWDPADDPVDLAIPDSQLSSNDDEGLAVEDSGFAPNVSSGAFDAGIAAEPRPTRKQNASSANRRCR